MKFNKRNILLGIGISIIPLFLLLLSFYSTLLLTNLSDNQQLTFDFLDNPTQYESQLIDHGATIQEISHMYDVYNIFNITKYIFFALLLVLTLIITYTQKNKKILQKLFFLGGITSIILPIIVGIIGSISFYKAFSYFHYIFFPQGNWQFSETSFLIQTFPLGFFQIIALKIFIFTLFLGSIFIIISLYLKHDIQSKRH
jgi:integral membrane protein (TIGR01906 family)